MITSPTLHSSIAMRLCPFIVVLLLLLLPRLSICDVLISERLKAIVNRMPCCFDSCLIGGSRGTQPLDVVLPLGLALEKGVDGGGDVAVAQCGVAKYYDSF